VAEPQTLLRSDAEEMLAVRALVPSEREIEAGLSVHEFVPEPEQAPVPPLRQRLGSALRGGARDMNLRTIARGSRAWPLLLLAAISMIDELDNNAFGVLVPDLRDVFNVGVTFLGILLAGTLFIGFGFAPLVGHLADRRKRVSFIRAGWLMRFGLGNLVASLGGSAFRFGAERMIGAGTGTALVTPMRAPLLVDMYRPSVQARVFAILGIGTQIGTFAGPVLGGILDGAVGPLQTMAILGGIGFALTLLTFFVREPKRGEMARTEMAELGVALPPADPPVPFGEAIRALKGVQTVRRMWIAIPFMAAAAFGVRFYLGLYFAAVFNAGPVERGWLLALSGSGGVVALLAYGPVVDRLFRDRPGRVMSLLAAFLLLEGLAAPVIAVMPSAVLAALVGIFPAFVSAIFLTALFSIGARVVPQRIQGIGQGSLLFFTAVGLGFVLPVIFYLSARFGFRAGIVYLMPISLLAAILVMQIGPHVEKDIAAAEANLLASQEARRSRESGRNKLLICRGVEVFFDGAQVLFGVDLDVEEGELVALLGTNGAGKSTLLRAVAGTQSASYGAIFFDGVDITHVPAHRNAGMGVVMMPGGHAVFPHLTTVENLRAAAWLSGRDDSSVEARTEAVLDLFPRLRERLNTQAGSMSGGEQQMLALGQALLMKPRLLMIDELSLGLAPQVVEQLLDVLRRLHAEGTTIIIVEQSLNVALSIAERAVYMEKGQIRYDGPARDLVGRNDVVRSVFLGRAAASTLGAGRSEVNRLHRDLERETALRVQDLRLRYGGVEVLRGVSMEVAAGEVVGIVGPNGAGKTSLFDAVAGFSRPESGAVELLGTDVTGLPPDARARLGLGRSYQNVRLFPALTVRENIAVALERHLQNRSVLLAAVWSPITRRVERRVARRVDNLVESLGLAPYADKFMSELSTGTRRIVDIACLLAAGPRVLLLDEPSSGLAQAETEQLAPVIARIVKETGAAVVVIEHDLGLVASVSDRLVAMRLGSVMAEGRPRDVLDDPTVIDALLGGASAAVLERSVELAAQPSGAWR